MYRGTRQCDYVTEVIRGQLSLLVIISFTPGQLTTMALGEDLQMPRCCGIDIEEASILELQEHMTKGRITSAQLTECYLQRIKLVNPYTRFSSHNFLMAGHTC